METGPSDEEIAEEERREHPEQLEDPERHGAGPTSTG
jgi:hypothetical protein